MKTVGKYLFFLLSFLIFEFEQAQSQSQCNGNTPTYTLDLSSKADSIWISPLSGRNGSCCSGGNNCVQFIVKLSANAEAIVLQIESGAAPSGSLTYTVNCGTPTAIGQKFCVTGQGPHSITFCKNGGNQNTYRITSIPKPMVQANFATRVGCNSKITASGFQESTIQWKAITNGTTYQSTIQCTSGCDTTIITTPNNPPAYIDYEVSGTPTGACSGVFARDTVRVSFVGSMSVNVTASNTVICKGSTSATITANVTGGNPPYTYLWSNGQTTQSINVPTGTYSVSVSDVTSCPNTSAQIIITNDNDNTVNAGSDRTICQQDFPIVLAGTSTQGATWVGGNGTFSPNRTTLNASYTPSASELTTGSVQIILQGNACSHCPALKDTVLFTLKTSPQPSINGSASVCGVLNQVENYSVDFVTNDTYNWTVNGGQIVSSSQNTISIRWNSYGTYQLQLKQSRPNGCEVTKSKTINVSATPVTPLIHRD